MPDDMSRESVQQLVERWYRLVDKPVRNQPTVDLPADERILITSLIQEETAELIDALSSRDLQGVADALGDIAWVIYGAALQVGVDLDKVIRRVYESNMTKPNQDGSVVRDDLGKVLPGASYVAPKLDQLLELGWPRNSD